MFISQQISVTLAIAALCAVESVVGIPEFPTTKIERCKAGDTTCLAATITKVVQGLYPGIPELALAPIDPLRFHDVFISQSGDRPVTMDLSLSEGDIIGFRNMTITNVVGFDKDPKTSKFELVTTEPVDTIVGKYEVNGKLLLVPIQGKGDLNITHIDLKSNIRLKVKVVTRDNEDYLEIRKVHVDLSCKTVVYELGNLFNNKEISDGLNKALNADPQLVFDATRKSLGEARAGVFQKYLAPFFEKIPYRMLFAD